MELMSTSFDKFYKYVYCSLDDVIPEEILGKITLAVSLCACNVCVCLCVRVCTCGCVCSTSIIQFITCLIMYLNYRIHISN